MPFTTAPKTNDLKKGMRVKLRNGFEAEIIDNRKGNIRDCKVFGVATEMGSVYAYNIIAVQDAGRWIAVQHNAQQLRQMKINELMGF